MGGAERGCWGRGGGGQSEGVGGAGGEDRAKVLRARGRQSEGVGGARGGGGKASACYVASA